MPHRLMRRGMLHNLSNIILMMRLVNLNLRSISLSLLVRLNVQTTCKNYRNRESIRVPPTLLTDAPTVNITTTGALSFSYITAPSEPQNDFREHGKPRVRLQNTNLHHIPLFSKLPLSLSLSPPPPIYRDNSPIQPSHPSLQQNSLHHTE